MAKKRTYRKVFNEIIVNLGSATDAQWEELFSLSIIFLHLNDGRRFASPDFPKWEKKFLEEMIATATESSDWFSVATSVEQYSAAWNEAIKNLLKNARESENVLYRWDQIKFILPKDHPNQKEVKSKISTIRKERRELKEALV